MSTSRILADPAAASSDHSQIENKRPSIEANIRKYLVIIAQLREDLNDTTPISRLPPEILGVVFIHYADDVYQANVSGTRWFNAMWKTVTVAPLCRVCRRWRAVAMATPRMWSKICYSSPAAILDSLKRSKRASLSFSFYNHRGIKRLTDTFHQVARNFHRMQECSLIMSKDDMAQLFQDVSGPAALLEDLRLELRLEHLGDSLLLPPLVATIGESRLRSIGLHNVLVQWDNPLLGSTVTSLILRGNPKTVQASDLGTFSDLLRALRRMPALNILQLEGTLPSLPPSTPFYPSIPLLHLRRLVVSATTAETTYLLRHLAFTVTHDTNLRIRVVGIGDIEDLACTVARTLEAAPPIEVLDYRHAPYQVDIRASRSAVADDDRRPLGDVLELSVCNANDALVPYSSMVPVLSHLAAGCRPSTLVVYPTRSSHWNTILGFFPNITTLITTGAHRASFRRAFTHLPQSGPGAVLPHLREIHLMRFAFKEKQRHSRAYKRLSAWLTTRRKEGNPLCKLVIRAGNVDDSIFARLANLVPVVQRGEPTYAGQQYGGAGDPESESE